MQRLHHTLHTLHVFILSVRQSVLHKYLLGIILALYCDNVFGYKHLVDKANIVNVLCYPKKTDTSDIIVYNENSLQDNTVDGYNDDGSTFLKAWTKTCLCIWLLFSKHFSWKVLHLFKLNSKQEVILSPGMPTCFISILCFNLYLFTFPTERQDYLCEPER